MAPKRKRTWAEMRAVHAKGAQTSQRPNGSVASAPMPPPLPPRPPVVRAPAPSAPISFEDDARDDDIDALKDALVLLAMATGGGDLAVQSAARELSRRRQVPLDTALQIMRHAKVHLGTVGKARKAMDPALHAELIGETRVRLMLLFNTAMKPENFVKGGAATAAKVVQMLAVLDGCPVDGMVQIVGHVEHEHTHRVVDPEREAIMLRILEETGVRRPVQRVIEMEEVGQ